MMGMIQRIKRARREYDGKARPKVLKGQAALVGQMHVIERALRSAISATRAEAAFTRDTRDMFGRTPEWEAQGGAMLASLAAAMQPPA